MACISIVSRVPDHVLAQLFPDIFARDGTAQRMLVKIGEMISVNRILDEHFPIAFHVIDQRSRFAQFFS